MSRQNSLYMPVVFSLFDLELAAGLQLDMVLLVRGTRLKSYHPTLASLKAFYLSPFSTKHSVLIFPIGIDRCLGVTETRGDVFFGFQIPLLRERLSVIKRTEKCPNSTPSSDSFVRVAKAQQRDWKGGFAGVEASLRRAPLGDLYL
jgi:hypothetical protein